MNFTITLALKETLGNGALVSLHLQYVAVKHLSPPALS